MKNDTAKRDRQSTEKKIIEAAFDLFADKGYKSATIRMISEKAECNLTLISRYFGSKKELFEKIVKIKYKGFNNFYVDYSSAETFEDLMHFFFKEALEVLYNNEKFFRMIIIQAVSDSQYSSSIEKIHKSGEQRFVKILENFSKKKSVNHKIIFTDISSITFHFLRGIIMKYIMDNEKNIEVLEKEVNIFIEIICNKKGLS